MAKIRSDGNKTGMDPVLWDSNFMRACRGEPVTHTPIWLMRQAGRYMEEYREVRANHSFLSLCKNKQDASKVTVDAQRIIGADAAIIFADILLILEGLGLNLTFGKGEGPRLSPTLTDLASVQKLGDPLEAAAFCNYVGDAIRTCRSELPSDIPLIGFCGAPFTLASYACEGGGSRQYTNTKIMMYCHTDAWNALMDILVESLSAYLTMQVEAGAQCLQIFDSWVGNVSAADYEEYLLPHMCKLVSKLPAGIPVILFGTHTAHLLPMFKQTNCDVIGIDGTCDLVSTWESLGGCKDVSVQGNLDQGLLLAPKDKLLEKAKGILDAVGNQPGHIFNLGHGIMKETNPQQVIDLISFVQEYSKR